jgi:hypothetical protein
MVRLFFMVGGLLCALISGVLVGTASRDMAESQKAYRPFVAAATDCLARAIHETLAALQYARAG